MAMETHLLNRRRQESDSDEYEDDVDHSSSSRNRRDLAVRKWKVTAGVAVLVAVLLLCIIIAVAVTCQGKSQEIEASSQSAPVADNPAVNNHIKWPPTPDDSQYRYAGVATSQPECAETGTRMLAEGGSAVDAAISVSLCLGVYKTISSGIGGGGFITIYQKATGKTTIINSREMAPLQSNATMYHNTGLKSTIGGGSIAVPGEVAGLWEAHQRFGKLDWSRLFEPSIKAAEKGIVVNDYLEYQLNRKNNSKRMNEPLRKIFTNPETNEIVKVGEIVQFPKLAETYKRIAKDGKDTFYNGTLKDDIMADLSELGDCIITADDWSSYKLEITEPVKSVLSNGEFTVLSPPPPSGGLVLQYILNILDGYGFTNESISADKDRISSTATTYHRIVEAFKFAYAKRSNLGDKNFMDVAEYIKNMTDLEFCSEVRSKITDDRTHDTQYYGVELDPREMTGTSQLSVIAGNGDAVSMTTSINFAWGSKRMGSRTGIIFNNLMDDFSKPGEPSWTDDAWTAQSNSNNWIEPGKRPLSAMSPSIVLDKEGNVRLVTGGSGGSKIITAAAMTIINNLWFGFPLSESVNRPRLHHQLLPTELIYEETFPQEYLKELESRGHEIKVNTFPPVSDSCSADTNAVHACGDLRRLGGQDGF